MLTAGLFQDLSVDEGSLQQYGLTTYYIRRLRPVEVIPARATKDLTVLVECVEYSETAGDGHYLRESEWLFLVRPKEDPSTLQILRAQEFRLFASAAENAVAASPSVPYQVSTTDLLDNPGPDLGRVASGKQTIVGIVVGFPQLAS